MGGWGLGLGLGLGAGASDRERAWRHFPHPAAAARNRGQGHSQWAAANNNDIIIVTLADAWPNLLPPSVPRCWHRLHESKDVLFVRVPHGLFTFLAKRFAALLVAHHTPLLVLCKTLTPPPPPAAATGTGMGGRARLGRQHAKTPPLHPKGPRRARRQTLFGLHATL